MNSLVLFTSLCSLVSDLSLCLVHVCSDPCIFLLQFSSVVCNKPCSREGSRLVRDYFTRVRPFTTHVSMTSNVPSIRLWVQSMRRITLPFPCSAYCRPCVISTIDKKWTKWKYPTINGYANIATKLFSRSIIWICIWSIAIITRCFKYVPRCTLKIARSAFFSFSRTIKPFVWLIIVRFFDVMLWNERRDRCNLSIR